MRVGGANQQQQRQKRRMSPLLRRTNPPPPPKHRKKQLWKQRQRKKTRPAAFPTTPHPPAPNPTMPRHRRLLSPWTHASITRANLSAPSFSTPHPIFPAPPTSSNRTIAECSSAFVGDRQLYLSGLNNLKERRFCVTRKTKDHLPLRPNHSPNRTSPIGQIRSINHPVIDCPELPRALRPTPSVSIR